MEFRFDFKVEVDVITFDKTWNRFTRQNDFKHTTL